LDIEIICDGCGKAFNKRKADVTRNKKLGRRNYCTLACCGKHNTKHLDKWRKNPVNLNRGGDFRSDELSPFRLHMKYMHNKGQGAHRKECLVTIEDLKEQWDKQQGICPLTGWQMKQPKNTGWNNRIFKTLDRASVDRIDSTKPYTKDNIRFIALIAQYAKNSWSDEDVLQFCLAVTKHQE
jgi:hypothetical protein